MLERYRDEPRVMMVSGDDYISSNVANQYSYYSSTYYPIWGWATVEESVAALRSRYDILAGATGGRAGPQED